MPCWSRDQQLKPQGVLQRYKCSGRELCNVYFSTIYSANNFSILNPSRQDLTVKVHSLLEIKTFCIKYCRNQAFTTTPARYCEQYATVLRMTKQQRRFSSNITKKDLPLPKCCLNSNWQASYISDLIPNGQHIRDAWCPVVQLSSASLCGNLCRLDLMWTSGGAGEPKYLLLNVFNNSSNSTVTAVHLGLCL